MQHTKVSRRKLILAGDRKSDDYLHSLQFYSGYPREKIDLQEFEEFALDRLKGGR